MNNKKNFPVVNIGTSLILSIFIILALVSFATLTYLTARRDAALSNRYVDATTQWNETVALANDEIARLDQTLLASYQGGTLAVGQAYSFTVPSGDDAALEVTLVATDPGTNNGRLYTITRYEKVATQTWQDESKPNLLQFN